MFGNRRYFRELLTHSEEGIATNILSNRLQKLLKNGLITKSQIDDHKQKNRYSLTEKSIQLVPILALIGDWGLKHLEVTPVLSIRARILAEGGHKLWERFMNELRADHLNGPRPKKSVRAELQGAYLRECSKEMRKIHRRSPIG